MPIVIMIGFQVSRLQPKIITHTPPAPDWIQNTNLPPFSLDHFKNPLRGAYTCSSRILLIYSYAKEGGQDDHATLFNKYY